MSEELSAERGEDAAGVATAGDGHSSKLTEVSRAMVKLFKEQFGRGPVRARATWAGEDMIVCVLEETLTPAEQNLRAMGEHQRLRDIRLFFQHATEKQFIAAVEQITGRTVRAFTSALDTEEDVAVETFVLHPRGSDEPSRAEKAEF